MSYTTNPNVPRLRLQAAKLVIEKGWSTRQVARYTGYNQSSIVRWVNLAKRNHYGYGGIPTQSSRPFHHPNQLSQELVDAILKYRQEHQRCAEVLQYMLKQDGYDVSISSVKRVLKRAGISKYSRWKKWHKYEQRPKAETPGILVEVDTIVDGPYTDRLYVYTMLDVCTRWSFAFPVVKIGAGESFKFVERAVDSIPFKIRMIQSDHGAEFSKHFTKKILAEGINHRHTRIRRPTDNGHLERFNRTIQEECLFKIPKTLESYQKAIPQYLNYYNTERPHMALNMLTPLKVMQSY